MPLSIKHLSLVTASILFIGCGGGDSTSTSSNINNPTPPGDVNDPVPVINDNTNPIFTSATNFNIKENKRFIVDIEASDQTQIDYTIIGGLDKNMFVIDKYNGTLIFKDNPDYESASDTDGDNIYEVTVKATDMGNNSVSKDFTITIEDEDEMQAKTYDIKPLSKGTNSNDIGTTPKSVYVLLSNSSKTVPLSPEVSHNKIVPTQKSMKETSLEVDTIHAKRGQHAPAYIQEFNRNVKKLLKDTATTSKATKKFKKSTALSKKDVEGVSKLFYFELDTSKSTTATARKVISNISTAFGTKTLNIWVSNDSFSLTDDTGCVKTKCVTQTMVNALAETFLKTGLNNDIYDWVTNIYGEEWNAAASNKYDFLIDANNEITILLTDIDNDNSENGGTIGYFFSKDNMDQTNVAGSNERVMFYIDAVMFANGDNNSWNINDAWPKEVVATLAHEFVHMIEFYQKTLMLIPDDGEVTDTWINEMMAETTEDLVATKIEHKGPRGVAHTDGSAGGANNSEGRYGLFNANNTLSLTTWNSQLADYSKVNAFGTYLTRNYGGAKVLRDMMHNPYWDEKAIVDAVNKATGVSGKTFEDLQKEWGIAVLLSDQENLAQDKPTYNTGDFTVSQMGDVIYKMGSINFFNYATQPSFSNCTTVQPQGNCYYKVGDNITGSVTIDLTLNATTSATLIVK